MSTFWNDAVAEETPWPREEDAAAAKWWDELMPLYRARWGPLLAKLGAGSRAQFHRVRLEARAAFRSEAGTTLRTVEEDAGEEALYQRVCAGIAKAST